ncbi:hypothetical protein [uncultured Erythrobacter sp.]|uniref:hypothetical protein n=1 Tax=uncultured Erythrobacter sp. TaxID=263913 RepID=UPI00262D04E5|nr:hypothetical protein [uncultured Erythrobacter sp.]
MAWLDLREPEGPSRTSNVKTVSDYWRAGEAAASNAWGSVAELSLPVLSVEE